MGNRLRGIALAGAVLVCAQPARALRVEKLYGVLAGGQAIAVVSEEALVRFDPAASGAQRDAALAAVGARRLAELAPVGWTHVALPLGMKVADGLRLLSGVSGILAVEPNHAYHFVKVPNDPQVPQEYQLGKINAFAGWEFETGSSSRATVAVIDAGIESTHPDLSAKMAGLAHQDCSGGACVAETPLTACNHATRVAGTAGAVANNGVGVAGVSWGAQLLSLRVFAAGACNPDCSDAAGLGSCSASDPTIINAINFAASKQNTGQYGKVVINMSLGGAGACSGAIQTAVTNAVNAGVVVVAAAGNDGSSVNNPGNCAGVIPVGATDSNDNVASFSSRGPELASGGLVAPGVNVVTTDIGAGYTAGATGTSFASPIVAGAAALILSAKPTFTPAQVQTTLRASADNIGVSGIGAAAVEPLGNTSGAGRLDVFRALRLAVKGTLSDFQGDQEAIAFPNPFRPSQSGMTTISVPVGIQGANPEIKVYAMDGQHVRTLTGQSWDGRNDGGSLVATGTYIFRVKTDAGSARGRVAVIR